MSGITKLFQLGSIIKNSALFGGLASLGAYVWSASEADPEGKGEGGRFMRFVDGKVLPAFGSFFGTMQKGIGNIFGRLGQSQGVQDAFRGAADVTGNALGGAAGLAKQGLEQLPAAGEAAGDLAGKGLATSSNMFHKFFEKIGVPEKWRGTATWVAGAAAAALGVTGVASYFGSGVWGFDKLGTLGMAPFKFVGDILKYPLSWVGAAVGVAAMVVVYRNWNRIVDGIDSLFASPAKEPEKSVEPELKKSVDAPGQHKPAQSYQPENGSPQMAAVLDGAGFPSSVTGGIHTNTIAKPSSDGSPARDSKARETRLSV